MCTGHLYAGRGADLFLALAKEIPGAHFVWVGGKPDDVEVWKRRAQSGNVTFTGFILNQDLPLYQSAQSRHPAQDPTTFRVCCRTIGVAGRL
jgi:hypothetical protein